MTRSAIFGLKPGLIALAGLVLIIAGYLVQPGWVPAPVREQAPDCRPKLKDLSPILPDRPVSFTFTAVGDGLRGLDLVLATYARVNSTELVVSVFRLAPGQTWPKDKNKSELISRTEFTTRTLVDWGRRAVVWPPIKRSHGVRFAVELSAPGAVPKDCVAAVGQLGRGTYFVGTEVRVGLPACEPIYQPRPYPWLARLGWLAALALWAAALWPRWRPVPALPESDQAAPSTTGPNIRPWLRWLLLGLFVLALVRTAWVAEDAYITFRASWNLVHGLGLTWNPVERVQAFTNPAWMFLTWVWIKLFDEVYFTSLIASALCSLGAVYLVGFRIGRRPIAACLGLAVLVSSQAFVDYSTSGLENPLSHLLLALFYAALFGERARRLEIMFLLAGLIALNRLDLALLTAPALVHLLLDRGLSLKKIGAALIGLSPLLVWLLFALFYYGTPFPNTAFAKLNTGYSALEKEAFGLGYLYYSLLNDPITLVSLAVGIGLAVRARSWKQLTVALGAGLYLGYTVRIGGDFMAHRFLAAPVLAGAVLISRAGWTRSRAAVGLTAVIILGLISSLHPLVSGPEAGASRPDRRPPGLDIENERLSYYPTTGLLRQGGAWTKPSHHYVDKGRKLQKQGVKLAEMTGIGLAGYYAGPKVHILDEFALADALLARLPARAYVPFRPGHASRAIPAGYRETLVTGQNKIRHPDLAAFYDQLRPVIRGRLWSRPRLKTIVKLNLPWFSSLDDLLPKDRYWYALDPPEPD